MAVCDQTGIQHRVAGDGADAAGGGEFDGGLARRIRPGGVDLHGGVRRAGEDGGCAAQPRFRLRSAGDGGKALAGADKRRHPVRRDASQMAQAAAPRVGVCVQKQKTHGLDVVGDKISGQAVSHIVLDGHHPSGSIQRFRLMP